MNDKLYQVSEAVRLVGVEPHVLRYWEEELGFVISRSKQGHRIYHQRDIDAFCRVKELKNKGLQLKAIRVLFEGSGNPEADNQFRDTVRNIEGESKIEENEEEFDSMDVSEEESLYEIIPVHAEKEPAQYFVSILREMMVEVTREQNRLLEQRLTQQIREEITDFYLQYLQNMNQVASAREKDAHQNRFLKILKELLRKT